MTIRTNIASALALSSFILAANTSASLAEEAKIFKPGHGISFEAGDQHGVGYFTNDKGRCDLVLTLAGESNWDDNSLKVTRNTFDVPAGQSTKFANFEFGCTIDAQAMTFKPLTSMASVQTR